MDLFLFLHDFYCTSLERCILLWYYTSYTWVARATKLTVCITMHMRFNHPFFLLFFLLLLYVGVSTFQERCVSLRAYMQIIVSYVTTTLRSVHTIYEQY